MTLTLPVYPSSIPGVGSGATQMMEPISLLPPSQKHPTAPKNNTSNLYPSFPPSNSPKQVEFPHHQAAKILTPSIIRGRLGLRVVTEITFRSPRCCRCGSLRASLEMIHITSDDLFGKSNGCKSLEVKSNI